MTDQTAPPEDHKAAPSDADPLAQEDAAEMARLGIVCVERKTYEWGGYRYSNASDALAAAKRGKR